MQIGIGISVLLTGAVSQDADWGIASLFALDTAGHYPAGYAQEPFTIGNLFPMGGAGFWGGGVYPPEFEIGHLFGPSTAGYFAGGYGVGA